MNGSMQERLAGNVRATIRRKRQAMSVAIMGGLGFGTPFGFGMHFAGVATQESIRSLVGGMMANTASALFPSVCGSLRDVEAVETVRVRYPLAFASEMTDWTAAAADNRVTLYTACESSKRETHFDLGDDEMREGSSALSDAASDMAREGLSFWDRKIIAYWEANNVAIWDGDNYFAKGRNVNGVNNADGVQDNLLDGVVADKVGLIPTADEAAVIIDDIVTGLMDLKDPTGKLINEGMTKVRIVVGRAKVASAFRTAIQKIGGGVAKAASVNIDIEVNVQQKAGIANANVYGVRDDAPYKAMVLQETAPETRMANSDARNPLNRFTYTSDRGYGAGLYHGVVKLVMA